MTQEPSYFCDECSEPATKNIQSNMHEYDITGDDFTHKNEWDGGINEFYCQKCYEKHYE